MTGVWEIVKIQELKQAGLYKKTVAEILSMDRGTVAKYWDCSNIQKQKPVYHRGSILDPDCRSFCRPFGRRTMDYS
jgi:hypothetical protein